MRTLLRGLALGMACLAVTAVVTAHVRLVHPSSSVPLYWANPENIGIVINSAGTPDIPDGSHVTAIQLAIEEWNSATGNTATLVEDTSPASRARTDWRSTNLHLVLFDENDESGYFPPYSQTVAITPVYFFGNGRISDADVLFNGKGFSFTTSEVPFQYDVQDVATHELGHLLGLDHSGWAGATMYPYVDPRVIEHRSLSLDEVRGLRDCYPAASFGRITGTIARASSGARVSGAHVVALDAGGRTAASILSAGDGSFAIVGLEPGSYTVYAAPLDAPVDEGNLGAGYAGRIETDFEPRVYPAPAEITGAEEVPMGTLRVGADVALNLGRSSDRFPFRVVDGGSRTVTIRGTGLFPGSTIQASDPDLILGTPMWFGSQVSLQVTVPDGEAPGHVDLIVTDATGAVSVLPAALEITPPSPTVIDVSPSVGGLSGGTPVTISGTNFNPGARIVIGDQIYVDGVGGTNVVDPFTITLTTRPTTSGMHDVVVIDATGEEGRQHPGFEFAAIPTVSGVFPGAGSDLGGTEVVLSGYDFLPGAVVRIDGVDQGAVTFESENLLRFTTTAGVPGARMLEVENPGGASATSLFTYTPGPDPEVDLVAPGSGKKKGGQTITISGANFTADTTIVFDVDETGAGGVPAAAVTFVDTSTLEVVTPPFPRHGAICVMASEPSTGQADVLDAAFVVKDEGGGGCTMQPVGNPLRPREILLGSWWLALVLLVLGVRARQPQPALRRL